MKYGIIGAGMMGREHIKNIALLEDTSVSALIEPDREQQKLSLELAPSAKVYESHKEAMSDSNIDVWVIASPNYKHIDALEDLFEKDTRPILVEKPICTKLEDCKRIEEMASSYSAPVWVAMEYRYMKAVSETITRVNRGIVGSPKMISIREHRFPFLKKVGDWNRFNVQTGGTLVEKCCHFFDLMRLLANDDVLRVYASGAMDVNFMDEVYDGKIPDIIDNAYVIVEFKSGIRASLDLCMFCDGSYFQEEIAVLGNEGKIECKVPGPDRLWAVDDLSDLGPSTGFSGEHRKSQIIFSPRKPKGPIQEDVEIDSSLQLAGDHHGSTFFQHQKFKDCILTGAPVEVSVSDGLKAVKIGLAAEESLRTHSVIEI